jgi:hypothetical protein
LREVASPGTTSPAPAHLRFTRDWSRVRCLDADADIALLEALESEIAARLPNSATDYKPVLTTLEDSLSNSIQITEPRACLAENIAAELDLLMKMYVEPLRVPREHRRTGRAAIAASMRTEFERAGVWPLMRKRIAASLYTQPGDPLRLDCGYRPNAGAPGELVRGGGNGVIKIFHAVSLAADVEAAKVLAYSAPRLHEGILRVENATLELTAIVEPLRSLTETAVGAPSKLRLGGSSEPDPASDLNLDDESSDRYHFGVSTLESQQIRVLTTADLARAAATARLDLHL